MKKELFTSQIINCMCVSMYAHIYTHTSKYSMYFTMHFHVCIIFFLNTLLDMDNHGSSIDSFSLSSFSQHEFFVKIMEWFPDASSKVLNSE